ncbi:MAG TPA: PIN domain-containing protein [Candidatus Nanoarchaeia archaeon]|nr:PIN domain-containing protein [Candidatus Nanoarchaeia archaeon]
MILLDSSAWVEMFRGNSLGNKIQEIIIGNVIYTCTLSIAEIAKWCAENGLNEEKYIKIIEENSTLLSLKRDDLIFAGKLCVFHKKKVHNFGLVDACIYASAHLHGAVVLTTDHHFKGLEGIELLE